MNPRKTIIDTDPATGYRFKDVDDGLAILYLLAHPEEFEVLGAPCEKVLISGDLCRQAQFTPEDLDRLRAVGSRVSEYLWPGPSPPGCVRGA